MTSRRVRHVGYTDAGIPIVAREDSFNCLAGAALLDHYSARHIQYTAAGIPVVGVPWMCCDAVDECARVEETCLDGGISQRALLYSWELQNCSYARSKQTFLYHCWQIWEPSVASNDNSAGAVAWSSASEAIESDDVAETATLSANESNYLVLTGAACLFPDGYAIYNVNARIEASATGTVSDVEIRLVVGGVIVGTNMATSTTLTGSDTVLEVSDTPTNWGVPTLSAADVQGDGFGLAIRYSGTGTVSVDSVDIVLQICPTPTGTGTGTGACPDCDTHYPFRWKWVGSMALRGGTISFEMCCTPPSDPMDPLTATWLLTWSGCETGCTASTFPQCYDPVQVNFGNVVLNECCGCGDTTEQGQINLYAVANCHAYQWVRHVDYTEGGIPIVAVESCGLVEPGCTCQPTCEWTVTILSEAGTGTGSSADCSCLDGSYSLPYIGSSTWENNTVGACSIQATARVNCTDNADGTVSLLVNLICGAQNIGYTTATVNCNSLDAIDETVHIHLIGPEDLGCGTCTFQWSAMAASWSVISNDCTGGCTCVDELTIAPGIIDGEQVALDCEGGGVSICCDGWVAVRLQRA